MSLMDETVDDLKARHEDVEDRAVRRARFELLHHVSALLEPVMTALGIVFLALLLMEYASVPLEVFGVDHLVDALGMIWLIFAADFLIRFLIAPVKRDFLRSNWLIGLSLAVPLIRPLHIFRAAHALQGLSLVGFLGAVNRSLRALRHIARGRISLYMVLVTLVIILIGGVGVLYFDRDYPESPVQSLTESLWWSATLVTTLNHEMDVVSTEAKLIAFGLRLYGLNVFCFFMASVASYLIGVDGSFSKPAEEKPEDALRDEVRELRAELREVHALLAARTVEAGAGVPAHDRA
jgi:voltage-gated potassium channel